MRLSRLLTAALLLVLMVTAASAQSVPNPGSPINTSPTCNANTPQNCTIWTPGQWVLGWQSKQDVNGDVSSQHVTIGAQTQTLAAWLAGFVSSSGGSFVNPAITGGTISGSTITTPTISGATISGSTLSGASLSTPTIANPTITSPSASGGTYSSPTITTPAISGGTLASSTLSSPTVTTPAISGGTISGTTLSTPVFTGLIAFPGGLTIGGVAPGTAAFANTGTSGTNVPLLSGINTWANAQTLSKGLSIPGWSIDVRAFGAVCDGTTSDSTAFQNAINSLTYGGRVLVPATQHGCYLAAGISNGSASISAISLEGVSTGTYFPGFTDNTQADWTQRGSWIICGDTVNACITENGNGSIIKNLSFWYSQPTPPSAVTCASPCTMTHNWTPTTYPYTILISSPQNFNAVQNVTIVNATNCIDVEGPSNGVGTFFTILEHLNLACFNNGIMLHWVDNPVDLHDVSFNIIWYQASSDVLGYTEGDSTHTGHKVDLSLEYAADVHLSGVKFVQSMTGIYTANATVTNGLGTLTFGAQALTGEGLDFIQDCQAMAVQNSTTILQGRISDVSVNTDPQTSTSTQCGGYLRSAFNLNSDNVEFGITGLDTLFANTVATIGGGTGGVLHIKGGGHAANYAAFNNVAAFVVNTGAALDIDNLNEYYSSNASAGPHISGAANWPQTFAGAVDIEGPTLSVRQQCFELAKTTAAFSTNQWCWVDDATSSANFGLYRFNTTTGAFVDIPITVNSVSGLVGFPDGISPGTVTGIAGTTLADNANAGSIGEVLSNSSTAALTSSTPAATASISVTPGDWDVNCDVNFQPSGTAVSTILMAQANTSVALGGSSTSSGSLNAPVSAGVFNTVIAPVLRVNVSTTTVVYCVGTATYTGSGATMGSAGFIRARRIR